MNIIPAQPHWFCKSDKTKACSPIVGWIYIPNAPLVAISLANDPQGTYHQHGERDYCALAHLRPAPGPVMP